MKIIGVLALLSAAALIIGWLALRGPDIPYAALEAKYADESSRFVDLPGGLHVHYREQGVADGPLLVLLHGFGDSFTTWEGWVRQLQGDFHLISVDFPGHGLTRAPAGTTLRGDALADFVNAFALRLQLPKFAVAGNSMGGGAAWQLASRHPERINALILVDAAGFANDGPPPHLPLAFKLLRYSAARAVLRNIDNRPLIREGLKIDVYDPTLITPALVDRWAELQRAPGHRAILMGLDPSALNQDTAAALAGVSVPTLILWGEADPLLEPASARKFAAAIPGARLITYPHVGHLPQIEIPTRSALDVAQFLRSLTAPR